MKKIIFTLYFIVTLSIIISCGGSSNKTSSNPTDKNPFSSVDTSQSYTKQLQQIFSNLEPHSQFFDVKIKEISHPSKFVGTWTMWNDFRGDKSTFNADGSCSDTFYYYKTGEKKQSSCQQWYHITLEDNRGSFLLFFYKDDFVLVDYEWNDDNNLYFHYFSGGGHLATRANSNPLAKNIEERFVLGTWREESSDITIFWTFDAHHKFTVKTYRKQDEKLVVDKTGTWSINKDVIKISVPNSNSSKNKYLARSIPPKNIKLDFLYGVDKLSFKYFDGEYYLYGLRDFYRYSEPLMILGDPFIGKFHAHETYKSYNVISLNIEKKSSDSYSVDIFWNDEVYLSNNATKVKGLLHVNSEFGTVIFKPVINGIQKTNILENNLFNFPKRILRTSQNPIKKEKTIKGRWIQSIHYSLSDENRYFTFLNNGKFFNYKGDYNVNIGREGTYREEGEKIYFKSRCGKEELFDTVNFNQEHYTPKSYKTSFVKVPNSEMLSSVWYALKQYAIEDKKRNIKLIPDPAHTGKFLFEKERKYSNVGSMTLTFQANGEAFAYNYYMIIYYDYYIEKTKDGEQIVMFKNPDKLIETASGSTLNLYDGRRTACYNNSIELGLN
jgi:hypothetical protein